DKDGWVTSQYADKIEAPQPGSSSDSSKPQDTSQPSGSQSSSSSSSSSPSSSESSTPSTPSTPPSTPQNGWYTVDGKKYYYQNYVPIKGWADIAGMRYYFDETTGEKKSLCGIDVSSHQGDINWAAVKEAGIEFAFIRVGYRGYETGKINLDSKFVRNITEAKKYGIKCGVYFYSVAKDEVEAAQEANFVLAALEGYTLDLPIVIDVEHRSDRVAGLSAAQRTNNTLAFIKVIKDSGRQVMIYTGHYFYHNYLEKNRLADIPLWIAYYTDDNKKVADVNYSYWQYTSSGKVPGISGNVDLDIYIPR
ncbi:MAG: GH25 family lysozyme, partial [Acutalibacteraceae bacterium]